MSSAFGGIVCWRCAGGFRGRRLGAGFGSGWSEELVFGVRAGRAGCRVVPWLPSRTLGSGGCCGGVAGVAPQGGVDGVADAAFEGAEGFFGGFAFADFLVVVAAAVGAPVADLGDGDHVDGVAVAAVAALGQPVHDAVARGHLDRGGSVVGGEGVAGGEPPWIRRC